MDSTMFILVGDHGEAFDEHNRRQHDNIMWEEGLRVPAIFYYPPLFPKQQWIRGLRQHIDLLPTIFDLLGVEAVQSIWPGKSIFQPVSPQRQIFFSCWYERQCMAMIDGQIKTIYHYNRQPMEVYDLIADPFERTSLAGKEPFGKAYLDRMTGELLRWRERVNLLYSRDEQRRIQKAISMVEPPVEHRIDVNLGPYVRLVGYDLHTPTLNLGGTIDITYIYQALKHIPKEWKLFHHVDLVRPHRFLNADHQPVGGTYPTYRWQVGEYIRDRHQVRIPANFPSGSVLRVYIGMWSNKQGRQPIVGQEGAFRTDGNRRLLVAEIPLRK
jgi:hypothetical protein